MKAVRFHGKEDFRVDDVEEPTPGPGQIKIRNAYAGICGSDLHYYYAPEMLPFDLTKPHPLTGTMPPMIMGHEFSGTVVEVGDGVEGIEVGDRGAVYPLAKSCGECLACRRGRSFSCPHIGTLGGNDEGGGLAEFTVFDASLFHVLPENVDLRMGALVEPLSVARRAVARSGVSAGGSALVTGAGPIGIGAWFALRALGVEKILVSEPSAERRGIITALGGRVVDPVEKDLAAAVSDLTGGDGVDVAIEAAGNPAAVEAVVSSLTPGGRAVIAAFYEKPAELNLSRLMMAETEIIGSVGYEPKDFDAVIAAMSDGFYDTTGWVTEGRFEDTVDAIGALRRGEAVKILLRVD